MKYLIGNKVINADHIVMAEYRPADSGIDEETDKPFSRSSNCKVTLTSTYLKESGDYNGNITGVAAVSDFEMLYDTDADRFWQEYISDAYQVVTK
jgi:hypothetical protein